MQTRIIVIYLKISNWNKHQILWYVCVINIHDIFFYVFVCVTIIVVLQRIYPYCLSLICDNYETIKNVTWIADWANYCNAGYMSHTYDCIQSSNLAMMGMTSLGTTKTNVYGNKTKSTKTVTTLKTPITITSTNNDISSDDNSDFDISSSDDDSKQESNQIINLVKEGFSRFTVHNGCKEMGYDALMSVIFFVFLIVPTRTTHCHFAPTIPTPTTKHIFVHSDMSVFENFPSIFLKKQFKNKKKLGSNTTNQNMHTGKQ